MPNRLSAQSSTNEFFCGEPVLETLLSAHEQHREAKRHPPNAPARRHDRVDRSAYGRWQLDAGTRADGRWGELVWRGGHWDQVVAADPDVVLVYPCGFDMARTLHEMP